MTRSRPDSTGDADPQDAARASTVTPTYGSAIDRAYALVYDEHPIDEPDEWGDLASFCAAADIS